MKRRWIILLLFVFFFGIGVYYVLPPKIAVLTYHDFVEDTIENNMQIREETFRRQMSFLKKHHYRTLKLKDIDCFLKHKCRLPKKSVLITMDDGWKRELTIAAPILKEYDLDAVIFYVGKNEDGENENFLNKEDLETLQEDYPNIEIASHSYNLHYPEAYLSSNADITKDIHHMKKIIKKPYYAYPYGKSTKEYRSALKKEGYKLGFTFGPDKEHRKLTIDDNPFLLPRLNFSTDVPMWKFILRLIWLS